jgi:serine/threonine-protein kinase 24/25/MST4
LVTRYQSWKSKQKPSKNNSPSKTLNRHAGGYDAATITGNNNGTVRSEWNFDDTIRGTIAGMPVELDLGDLEDEEEEWDLEHEEVEVWDGTTRIRNGTVIGGDIVGMNVSLVLPMERVELIAGIQRFSTSSRWFRSAHSFSRILATDAQVREYGTAILHHKSRIWQVDLARKAEC